MVERAGILSVRRDGTRGLEEPHALAAVTVGLHQSDAPRCKGTAHRGGGGALQRVLSALEAADGTAADLGTFGKLVLGPVEQGSGGPTLRRRKGHDAQNMYLW